MLANCISCLKEFDLKPNLIKQRPITHEFCEECYHLLLDRPSNQVLLNKIPASVIGYDFKGVVKLVNKQTTNQLRKSPEKILNKVGGEIVDCLYANHEKGCGYSLNCDDCIVMKYLNRTIETGENFFEITGNQISKTAKGLIQLDFKFSMEKLHDLILVRVDKLIE